MFNGNVLSSTQGYAMKMKIRQVRHLYVHEFNLFVVLLHRAIVQFLAFGSQRQNVHIAEQHHPKLQQDEKKTVEMRTEDKNRRMHVHRNETSLNWRGTEDKRGLRPSFWKCWPASIHCISTAMLACKHIIFTLACKYCQFVLLEFQYWNLLFLMKDQTVKLDFCTLVVGCHADLYLGYNVQRKSGVQHLHTNKFRIKCVLLKIINKMLIAVRLATSGVQIAEPEFFCGGRWDHAEACRSSRSVSTNTHDNMKN